MADDSLVVSRVAAEASSTALPSYEAPRIRVMSEQEILNSFQITQSMVGWWVSGLC